VSGDNRVEQIQKLSITKAVMNEIGEGDKLNVNYAPVSHSHITNVFNQRNIEEIPLDDVEQMMWTVLEILPEPKLRNLRLLAIDTVIKKFAPYHGGMKKGAEYLKVQRTYLSRLKTEGIERAKLL